MANRVKRLLRSALIRLLPDAGVRLGAHAARWYVRRAPINAGKQLLFAFPLFNWFEVSSTVSTSFGTSHHIVFPDYIQKHLFFFGVWEPAISRFIELSLSPGDVVVDVGANLGYHTCLAARAVGPGGRVHAIEASPSMFATLEENIALNGLENVRTYQMAVSDQPGTLKLYQADAYSLGESTTLLDIAVDRGFTDAVEIPALPLTDIVADADLFTARLIKIDVEGAEWPVVEGLANRLQDFSAETEWIIEARFTSEHDAINRGEDIVSAFVAAGYHCYSLPNKYDPGWYIQDSQRIIDAELSQLVQPMPPERPPEVDLLFSRTSYGSGTHIGDAGRPR